MLRAAQRRGGGAGGGTESGDFGEGELASSGPRPPVAVPLFRPRPHRRPSGSLAEAEVGQDRRRHSAEKSERLKVGRELVADLLKQALSSV